MSDTPDQPPAASGSPAGDVPANVPQPAASTPQSSSEPSVSAESESSAPATPAKQGQDARATKKPKKPKRPHRWRRRFTAALITLVVLAIIFRILLSLLLPWTLRRVARIYGLDCTYERADIYLTGGDVGLWHVKLTQLDDGSPVAQTDYCRADISPLQLFRGRLVVQRLEADGVDLTVQRNSDGTIPLLQHLLSKPAAPVAAKQPSPGHWPVDFTPPVGIDALRLTHLRAHVIDKAIAPAVDEQVEMDLRISDLASTVRKAKLTIELLRSDVLDSVVFEAEGTSDSTHLEADFHLWARGLHPSPLAGYLAPFGLHATADGLAVRAAGTIRTDVLPGKAGAIAGAVKLADMAVTADGQDSLSLRAITIDIGSVQPGSANISRILLEDGTFVASRTESGGFRVAGLEWSPTGQNVAPPPPPASASAVLSPVATAAAAAGTAAPAAPFVWSVDELSLKRFHASFKDQHVSPASELQFAIDDLTVTGVVGDPKKPEAPVKLVGHCSAAGIAAAISLRGTCSPFAVKKTAELDVEVSGVRPDALRPYLDLAGIQADLHSGTFTCRMTADMTTSTDQTLVANARLFDVRWGDTKELLALDEVQISGLGLAAGDIRVDAIDVKGPRSSVRHEASGGWLAAGFRLLPPDSVVKTSSTRAAKPHEAAGSGVAPMPPSGSVAQSSPIRLPKLDIGRFTWNGVRIRVDDDASSPPTSISIEEAGIEITDIHADFDPQSKATSHGTVHVLVKAPGLAGTLKMDGTVTQTPAGLAADLTVDGRDLSATLAAPYLKALNIEPTLHDGTLKALLHVDLAQKDDRYLANVKVSDVTFADAGEEMFGIDEADITGVDFRPPANPQTDPRYLEIGDITLVKPRGQIVREQNKAIRVLGIRLLERQREEKKDAFSVDSQVNSPLSAASVGSASRTTPRFSRFAVRNADPTESSGEREQGETGSALVPSPLYPGERVRVRGDSCELRDFTDHRSPQPSPLSTGERGQDPLVAAKKPDVLVLKKLTIRDAAFGWTDRATTPAAQTTARIVSGEVTGLTWGRPADPAKLSFTLKADSVADEVRIVDGTLSADDKSAALGLHIAASGLRQGMLASYLPPGVAVELKDGRFECNLAASAALNAQGGISASATVSKVNFHDGPDGPALFHLDAAKITIARLDEPGGVVAIDEISVSNAQAAARKSSDGAIHAMGLVLGQPVAATQPSAPLVSGTQPVSRPAPVPAAPVTLPAETSPLPPAIASKPLVLNKPKYPLITVGKLDLNLDRFTFTDESRAGAAPLVVSGLHFSSHKPIEALGEDPSSRNPIDLQLAFRVDNVVDSIKLTAQLTPFASQPAVQFDLTGTGVRGQGLLALAPEVNQALLAALPDRKPRLDGSALTDGRFHVHGEAQIKIDRLDPVDFSLARGIACDFDVKGLEFRGSRDGPVLLGVDELRSEGVDIRPAKQTVLVRTLEVNKITGDVSLENDGLHFLGVVLKIEPPPPPATQPTLAGKTESHPPVAKPGVSAGAAKTEPHAPPLANATKSPQSGSGFASPPTPSTSSASSGQSPQNLGEIRVNKVVVSGIDFTFRDRSVSPELIVPLTQLDIDVRDLSSRAMVEDRRVRFSFLLGAGKVPLPRRLQQNAGSALQDAGALLSGKKIDTQVVIEQRDLFSQIQSDGLLSFYPRPSGYVKTSISAFDLAELKSEAKRANDDLNNGVFDMQVDARLPGDGTMLVHSHYIFTDLDLQEAPNGPIMRFLHPPVDTLDALLHLLRDQDGSIDVPMDVPVKEGKLSKADIVDAALVAFASIVTKAIVAAPIKLAGTATDIAGVFIPGLSGDKTPKKEVPIVLTFPEGDTTLSPDVQSQLAALLKRMKETPGIEVTLRHTLGRDDVSRAALRANPSPQECRDLVTRLGRRKQELLRMRVELSGRARGDLASRPPAEAALTLDRLHSVERDLAATEDALDRVCDLLRPGADRQATRRTRQAALELGQTRLQSVRAALLASGLPAIGDHVHLTRPVFNPTSGTADGKVEIMVTVKKKS